jgi:hypothetical protein
MPDVRRELELVAIEFPPTPDLSVRVADELARVRQPRLRLVRRPVLIAALVLLIAAGTVFAAVPGVRHAVLEFFHLRGATIERRSTLPDVTPRKPAFGASVSLAEAQRAVPFRILVPSRYGQPESIHLRADGVTLVYTRPKAMVSEFRGSEDPEYIGKVVGPGTRVRRLTVQGNRAIWISGAPHFFFYRRPDGSQRFETLRFAANVLLLERGPLLIRVEGRFGLREAAAIAKSMK